MDAEYMRPRYSVPRGREGWPSRGVVDPGLSGPGAWSAAPAREWRRWVREEYTVSGGVLLLTPCSNVKPYPRSPMSRKIRGVLRRLGYWDPHGPGFYGSPRGLEWVYLSDLLALVPYNRAGEYPACCYEYPPDLIIGDGDKLGELRGTLRGFLERSRPDLLVLYLPSRYKHMIRPVLEELGDRPKTVEATYHIFHGHRNLEKVLREEMGLGRV